MDAFSRFCGGELFNASMIFNESIPQLTTCFRETLLYWVPFACYLILFPFWIYMLNRRKILPQNLPRSFLFYTKLNMTALLTLMCIGFVIYGTVSFKSQPVNGSYFTLWSLFTLLNLMTLYVIHKERRAGKYSSIFLFTFYSTLVIASIPNILWLSKMDKADFYTYFFYFFYAVLVCEVIVFLFAERFPYQHDKSRRVVSPEPYASVFSSLTFSYCTSIIALGYKKALTMADLWDIDQSEKTDHITGVLEKEWNKELKKFNVVLANQGLQQLEEEKGNGASAVKTHSLKGRISSLCRIFKWKKATKPRFWVALMKAFLGKTLSSAFLKLIYDLLQFSAPMILQLILSFIQTPSSPVWLGIFYSVLLFAVTMLQTFILHQYFKRMMNIGQRWRMAVIGMIYRKSLKLSSNSRQASTLGEIVNLMSVDAQKLLDLTSYLQIIWSGPLQIILALVLLWNTLGPSIFVGVAVLILCIPLNVLFANKLKKLQVKQMRLKDSRIKYLNEILNGIKVIKLYAWEPSFINLVNDIRKEETEVLKYSAFYQAAASLLWSVSPFLVSAVTFAVYVLSSDANILTAEKAFVSVSLFNLLRFPLSMFATVFTSIVQADVSIRRINRFLLLEEIDPTNVEIQESSEFAISVSNGLFKWSSDSRFQLKNINLEIPKGSLIAVIGDVGSGKTALISALLGEMKKVTGNVCVNGSVGLVSQLAWIQNLSLKDNVLFEKPYDPVLYQKTIEACALVPDLQVLPDGDRTEIGEKGINLSGGQKQRVSLARAVYSGADIYLFDDPLSAVDSHVAQHLFKHVFGPGGLLSDKTRILVTNNLKYLPLCDAIVCLKDGMISEMGSFKDLMKSNGAFASHAREYIAELDDEEELNDITEEISGQLSPEEKMNLFKGETYEDSKTDVIESKKSKSFFKRLKAPKFKRNRKERIQNLKPLVGKRKHELVEKEHIESSQVQWRTIAEYFKSFTLIVLVSTIGFFLLYTTASLGADYWLSDWSDHAEEEAGNDKRRNIRIIIYAVLGILNGVFFFFCQMSLLFGCYIASKVFHLRFLRHIMRAPMLFFDVTPTGRIINRFSKDIDTIDYTQPTSLRWTISAFSSILSTIIIIAIGTPVLIIMFLVLIVIFFFIQRFYIAASRQLRRLESVSRSPIYSHFSETVQGIQTIRAFKAEERFINRNNFMNDENVLAYYLSIMGNRWLAILLESLANIIIFAACISSVTRRGSVSAGIAGLSITYAMNMTQYLNWLMRMISEIETNIVAVERILEYCEIATEAPWTIPGQAPSSDWPYRGSIDFKNYSLRYRPELDLALKSIDLSIKGGEKVGVVGRTGAGKSSLTLGLFRLIEACNGEIIIDGKNISLMGVHDLRSKLTIIPQDPVLFSGSLRKNFDPFDMYSDETIWWALKHSHLEEFVKSLDGQLNYEIYDGGENLSAGQKQLVCLARALLRKTKILILDEATAAVDIETDNLIQRTIRTEFSDCTIITIAHRLHTVLDYDRIVVLDSGEIKEFDSPKNLLSNQNTLFYKLARDAGIRNDDYM